MNSKNLAIVWAPNLFRSPPSITCGSSSNADPDSRKASGGDPSLLRGLNAQTGLCNYILVHAVYLFSLEKDTLSLPRIAISDLSASVGSSSCHAVAMPAAASPDLDRHCINVNGGPSTLPVFRTVLERPRRRFARSSNLQGSNVMSSVPL
ncbi:unnamed protein product [Gongylonema pulchrum]|uniref:Rho-GAP domain-containing protein n=1 Tax=Gongylonema pulchrum TaxID=637853 RepID=A0A183EZ89_9BILA|nr:unnamed protein product [Gongylonema pulchrum]